MKHKLTIYLSGLVLILCPYVANAQMTAKVSVCKFDTGAKLQDLLHYIGCIINNAVIPLIFALAIAFFVWGVVQNMIIDSEEAKTKGRDFILWGIIALTVMVSVWGLVKIVGNTFGVKYIIPQVQNSPSQ